METFGIWNLLKSLLTSEAQPISSPEKSQEHQSGTTVGSLEPPPSAPPHQQAEQPTSTEQNPEKTNACEEYFLRHERLSRDRKK